MRRTRAKKIAVSVELFPFLAVLMCTMGALILLLLLIARQSRIEAARAAAIQPDSAAIESRQALLRDQIAALEGFRSARQAELAKLQRRWETIADLARRRRAELAGLSAASQTLPDVTNQDQLQKELTRLSELIAETEDRLDAARRAAAAQGPAYAILPYLGPNGTRRRPIYIECRANRIVLQPEGTVLTEADFQGLPGLSNPLSAGVRAAAAYLERTDAEGGEPYPLFLVRPEGIGAYYAARDALAGWRGEFGYELIDADWELAYDPPNPGLAEQERLAVAEARRRQEQLALAAPRLAGGRKPTFRVAPNGAVVRQGGSGEENGGRRPTGGFATGPDERRRTPENAPAPRDTTLAPVESPSEATTEAPAQAPQGPRFPPHEAVASDQPAKPSEFRPGEYREPPPRNAPVSEQGTEGSLSDKRGKDWALPDAARSSIPITRPIRIRCEQDALTILPERGESGGEVVPLGPRTSDSVDELVSGVWEHMEEWGIAGKGMYWRPILQMEVSPQANERYRDLESLLGGSGLTVRRKGAPPVTSLPPVSTPR